MTNLVGQRRMPTLKEVCLRNIASGDATSVSFAGVPPHLIAEILDMVRSPDDLRMVQDRPENREISGFDEAADAKWYGFILKKFWVGKPNPPELGGLESWRDFYELLYAQREEAKQASRMRIDDAEKEKEKGKKKKLAKIIDISKVKSLSPQPQSHGKRSPGLWRKHTASPKKKTLSTDFEKMLRARR